IISLHANNIFSMKQNIKIEEKPKEPISILIIGPISEKGLFHKNNLLGNAKVGKKEQKRLGTMIKGNEITKNI
ncbi:hypothetical protein ACFLYU_04375, partial [Candidatus Dependentiae bacterium]